MIDGHVHFREPGLEYKEDWATGSTAAVYGGVTTVVEMPNTKPKTDTVENVELKRRLAEEKSYVDFGIIGLLVQDSVPQLQPDGRGRRRRLQVLPRRDDRQHPGA